MNRVNPTHSYLRAALVMCSAVRLGCEFYQVDWCACVCARFRRYHISQALRVRSYVHACQPLKLIPFFPLSVTTDRLDRLSRFGCRIFAACSQPGEQVGCGFVCRCVSLGDGASFKSPVCCLTFPI